MLGDASRRPKIGASAHNDKIQNFDGKMPRGAATLQKLKQNDEVHYPCRFSNLFSHEFQMTPPKQSKFWVALAIAPKNHELENAMV